MRLKPRLQADPPEYTRKTAPHHDSQPYSFRILRGRCHLLSTELHLNAKQDSKLKVSTSLACVNLVVSPHQRQYFPIH